MIKKIRAMFVFILMLFAVPSFAFAVTNDTTTSNSTTTIDTTTNSTVVDVDPIVSINNTVITSVDNDTVVDEVTSDNDGNINDSNNDNSNEIDGSNNDVNLDNESKNLDSENEIPEEPEVSETPENEIETPEAPEVSETQENEIENEDESERYSEEEIDERNAHITKTQLGAKIRLLQLKDRLKLQIDSANEVVNYLNNKNVSTTNLESIVVSFESLLVELDELSVDNVSTADVLAEKFVAIRKEATQLSKDFRATAKILLSDDDKSELRKKLKEIKKEHKKIKNVVLKRYLNKHNLEKAKEIMNKMGIDPVELARQFKAGEINIEDLKAKIRDGYKKLDSKDKKKIRDKFREEKQKLKIESKLRDKKIKLKVNDEIKELKNKLKSRDKELRNLRKKLKHLKGKDLDEMRNKLRKSDEFNFEKRERKERKEKREKREKESENERESNFKDGGNSNLRDNDGDLEDRIKKRIDNVDSNKLKRLKNKYDIKDKKDLIKKVNNIRDDDKIVNDVVTDNSVGVVN